MKLNSKILKNPEIAYFIGAFMADGCFYFKHKNDIAFEFYDGSSIIAELKYSLKHIKNVRSILLKYFKINSYCKIKKRKNLYILYFKSKQLADVLINIIRINPGKKASIVDVPKIYRNTRLEKYFWLGFMDCDGMIARKSKKVALSVSSPKLIDSFKKFLEYNKIGFKYSERDLNNRKYFTITIPSIYIKDYHKKIGFRHPRKQKWLKFHVSKKEIYRENIINFTKLYNKGILNYKKLFLNTNAYVKDGLDLIKKYDIRYSKNIRQNIKFIKLYKILRLIGLSDKDINKELSKFKWKMGKGSKYSIRLPHKFDIDLYDIAKFIKLRRYGIIVSRNYSKVFGLDYKKIMNKINYLFDIKPSFTCKNEPIYCSGILDLFFSRIISYKNL